MKRIAVLMTCYNRVDTTLECLRRLFAQEIPEGYSFDVWLVDDASLDRTGEKVKAAYPQVNVIQGSGKLFWCKGMRLAWDMAAAAYDYDFYLWLNDDVKLKDGAIAGMLADWCRVNGVVVGAFSSDESESDISYGASRKMPDGATPRVADAGMNGNFVLVPRKIYESVGPICGKYHHQYGDYDYGWQLRKKGFEFYSSSHFCGVCPQQPERYSQSLAGLPLFKRVKLLSAPKGFSLHDAFIYKCRNWGPLRGIISVIHISYKVIFAHE